VKILLLRHGPPVFNHKQRVGTDNIKQLLEAYAFSRVTTNPSINPLTFFAPDKLTVITSKLPRAIDTATLLGFKSVVTTDLLNESSLPHPNTMFIKLPWSLFVVLYRIAWFLGYRNNAPGKSADVARAKACVSFISQYIQADRPVVLIGHGIMNRLIKKELSAQGWRADSKGGSGYWSLNSFSLNATRL